MQKSVILILSGKKRNTDKNKLLNYFHAIKTTNSFTNSMVRHVIKYYLKSKKVNCKIKANFVTNLPCQCQKNSVNYLMKINVGFSLKYANNKLAGLLLCSKDNKTLKMAKTATKCSSKAIETVKENLSLACYKNWAHYLQYSD